MRKERRNKAETGIWGQNFRLSGCRDYRGAEAKSPIWDLYHVMMLATQGAAERFYLFMSTNQQTMSFDMALVASRLLNMFKGSIHLSHDLRGTGVCSARESQQMFPCFRVGRSSRLWPIYQARILLWADSCMSFYKLMLLPLRSEEND